jgi:hypothetical protein
VLSSLHGTKQRKCRHSVCGLTVSILIFLSWRYIYPIPRISLTKFYFILMLLQCSPVLFSTDSRCNGVQTRAVAGVLRATLLMDMGDLLPERVSQPDWAHSYVMLRLRMHGFCLQYLIHFHGLVLRHMDRIFIADSLLCIFFFLCQRRQKCQHYNLRSFKRNACLFFYRFCCCVSTLF